MNNHESKVIRVTQGIFGYLYQALLTPKCNLK